MAWGQSLGGIITELMQEKYPELLNVAAPLCVADNISAELKTAGDFLWGFKVLFDPSIKAGGYSAGAAGYAESMQDLVKVFTVLGKLQAKITTNDWPDTSSDFRKITSNRWRFGKISSFDAGFNVGSTNSICTLLMLLLVQKVQMKLLSQLE
jgi:hypothetical protein